MKKIVALLSLLSLSASAYEYKAGQWLLKGLMGKSVYFAQDPSMGQIGVADTIQTGFEFDYILRPQWSIGAGIRPMFGTNVVVLGFTAHGKYRFVSKDMPLVPYLSFAVAPSFLIPTRSNYNSHFNLGFRPAVGFEYFVARDLALGLEAGITPSFLFGKGTTNTMEATFEVLAGVTWRL